MSSAIYWNQHVRALSNQGSQEELVELIGGSPDDQCLIFTTPFEAYFHLYYSIYIDIMREEGRNHILTTHLEPRAFAQALKKVEPLGVSTKKFPVNLQGQVTEEIVEEAIGPRTALISLSWANALTGVIHPIESIAALCKRKKVLLHVDATHLFGKHYFRFQDLSVDFLTLMLNGKVLLFKKRQSCVRSMQAVDQDAAELVHAARVQWEQFNHICTETARLLAQFKQKILSAIPGSCIHFEHAERLPNTMALSIPGVSGKALQFLLERQGIFVTTGEEGEQGGLAQILMQAQVDPQLAFCAFSVALSESTDERQIERASSSIISAAHHLRRYSQDLW